MKTLAQFITTRTACADLHALQPDFIEAGVSGFVYDRDCCIQLGKDGRYYLTIYNEQYASEDLRDLEPILYAFCVTECGDEWGIPEDVRDYIAGLYSAIGGEKFAKAMLENLEFEEGEGICVFGDYCDSNQVALNVVGEDADDDVAKAIDLMNRAMPITHGYSDDEN